MTLLQKLILKRKNKLNYGAMMLVAKEARQLELLNFNRDEPFCSKAASFTVDVGDGVTGTVTLTPIQGEPERVHVVLEFDTVYIQSHLYKVGGTFEPLRRYNIYSTGGIPDAIVEMALNPVTMQEVFG